MKRVRALIIGEHRLFCDNLQTVLESQSGIDVVGVVEGDAVGAVGKVRELQPDVVIIDAGSRAALTDSLLEAAAGEIKIIRVTLEHNRAVIYRKESMEHATIQDLINVVLTTRKRRSGAV